MQKKIEFENNAPYKIEVRELDGEEMHFHEDVVEAIFVIKGDIYCRCPDCSYKCGSGKGMIITPREDHSISSDKLCVIAKLYFNPEFFDLNKVRTTNDILITFNAAEELSYAYEFRNLMMRILLLAYRNTEESRKILRKLINQAYHIFIISITQHPCYKNSRIKLTQPALERYKRILDYIQENYTKHIQISEIAEKEHISETRLSHFWKSITGLSFQNTVILLKMLKAEELIISSDLSIQDISELCGFSEIRYFYKYFKEQFKTSPQKYREQYMAALHQTSGKIKNRILSDLEAESYINQYIMRYYIVNNELPPNILPQEEITREKVLSDLFEEIQKNQWDVANQELNLMKMSCTIPFFKNKGVLLEKNEYSINWEYVYIAIQYIITCGFDASILIDYEIMEEVSWRNILTQFQEEVYRVWGRKLPVTFNCIIMIRKFHSYEESRDLINRFMEWTSIFRKADIMYIL